MYAPGNLAGEIIAKHRRAPEPVVLIGHSSGADAAISIAQRLRAANIPVALMFGFDPTPSPDGFRTMSTCSSICIRRPI